jgi:exonuclease III
MKPKILSWNLKGLNERHKLMRIMNLLREWKIDFVCLQETKLEFLSRAIVHSL